MKKLSGIIAVAAVALLASCSNGKYEYPFQNPKLKVDKRVDNLMSLLPFVTMQQFQTSRNRYLTCIHTSCHLQL